MAELEKNVRSIKMDGLLWGAGKLVAVGYGIKKLQICCVVEDDKVMMDDLEEKITDFDDFVSCGLIFFYAVYQDDQTDLCHFIRPVDIWCPLLFAGVVCPLQTYRRD